MNIYTPYTYLIGWSEHQIYYYGVRFAKNCHPNDLWKSYYTSSKRVKEFRKEHGEPDIIQIRKKFKCPEKAKLWEGNVLKKMNVKHRQDFLNITDTNNIVSKAMSDGLKSHWANLDTEQRKIRSKSAVDAMQAKLNTPEVRKKLSEKTGARMRALSKEEMYNHLSGVRSYHQSFSKEERSNRGKMLAAMRKTVTCPHCDKTGSTGNMNRWHFDNCKFKI